jgi:type VI secretion system secreted protein VgrG
MRRSLADGSDAGPGVRMNAPDFSSLGLFGTGLSQHARLITLSTAQDSGLPEALAAERFTGREAVNELFSFEIDALSTSTDLDLSLFLGEASRWLTIL